MQEIIENDNLPKLMLLKQKVFSAKTNTLVPCYFAVDVKRGEKFQVLVTGNNLADRGARNIRVMYDNNPTENELIGTYTVDNKIEFVADNDFHKLYIGIPADAVIADGNVTVNIYLERLLDVNELTKIEGDEVNLYNGNAATAYINLEPGLYYIHTIPVGVSMIDTVGLNISGTYIGEIGETLDTSGFFNLSSTGRYNSYISASKFSGDGTIKIIAYKIK